MKPKRWNIGQPDPDQMAMDEAAENEVLWGYHHPECLDSAEDFAGDDL